MSLTMKIYNKFSNSAKKVKILQECFGSMEEEYRSFPWHIPMRSVSHLPEIFERLKVYENMLHFKRPKNTHALVSGFINDQ